MAKSEYYVVSHYEVDEDDKKTKKILSDRYPTLFEAREFGSYYIQKGMFVSLKNSKGTLLPV